MTRKKAEIDPITVSVLWGGLVSITDDMGSALRRTAFSEAVREGDDFSTGLFDRQARMIAQGNLSVGHLGAMPYAVKHVLDYFPVEELRPGDCILLNDSFLGSGHYPDCYMTTPVFMDGDLVGFAVNSAHHVDMGGAVPGVADRHWRDRSLSGGIAYLAGENHPRGRNPGRRDEVDPGERAAARNREGGTCSPSATPMPSAPNG